MMLLSVGPSPGREPLDHHLVAWLRGFRIRLRPSVSIINLTFFPVLQAEKTKAEKLLADSAKELAAFAAREATLQVFAEGWMLWGGGGV